MHVFHLIVWHVMLGQKGLIIIPRVFSSSCHGLISAIACHVVSDAFLEPMMVIDDVFSSFRNTNGMHCEPLTTYRLLL
jgi:hypothetical protein